MQVYWRGCLPQQFASFFYERGKPLLDDTPQFYQRRRYHFQEPRLSMISGMGGSMARFPNLGTVLKP